jgi:transposase
MEATARYWESLYYYLQAQGYRVILLHPAQTHQFAERRGLRAKTDKLDAVTIARMVLSEEARPAYVPNEQIAIYRELVRLQTSLSEAVSRYHLELLSLVGVQFPEFTQIFADLSRPTALGLLKLYPGAKEIAEVGVESLTNKLHELSGRRYGRCTAQRLVELAQHSIASGIASASRAKAIRILSDQLEHSLSNLTEVSGEIEALVSQDEVAQRLLEISGWGLKTVAVVRAELGEVSRFRRSDQTVAYAGLDLKVRDSGKWKGYRKLSKRGSGRLRRALYMAALRSLTLEDSAFRSYYEHLVSRGLKKMSALMAVMRKMLLVAYHLLATGERYDGAKVWVKAVKAVPRQDGKQESSGSP